MRNFLTAASVAGLTFLAACSTPTVYAPAMQDSYGFAETQIEQNRWQVTFSGNSLTDMQTVETYLLYRAAELTNQQGFDYFIMVDRKLDEDSSYQSTGFPRDHFGFSHQYFDPRFGWRSRYDPFYNDFDLREVSRYRAIAEVVMGRGPKPAGDPHAYAAEDVLMNLSPRIQRSYQN